MPILFYPRSRRFFESAPCPRDCMIPTGDSDAYDLHPKHHWVYNKLTIAELQGIRCGPHKTNPESDLFPIFSKPIYNLGGMGANARMVSSQEDYWHSITPGHMWSTLLTGDHYSTDIAVVDGTPVWFAHTRGTGCYEQTWDYWAVNVPGDPLVEGYLTRFITAHLTGYTGMMNTETIGGTIIEVHLRFSPQWPDLYGAWFLPALVDLYSGKGWTGPCSPGTTGDVGYSVVLFDDEKYALVSTMIKDETLRSLEGRFGVSSITLRYDASKPLASYARPIGGFRIAWINGDKLEKCKIAREGFREYIYQLYDTQRCVENGVQN